MTSETIKIGIPGAAGRMGRMLIREIATAPDLELVAATDRPDSDAIGQDSGLLAGTGNNGVMIADTPDTLAAADVIIDFTSPAASVAHAGIAGSGGAALVVGTTGLTANDEEALRAAAAGISLVYCANTSVGVTLLGKLVEQVQLVEGWDIEILESHHHHKVDAPSGTALALWPLHAGGVLRWMMLPTWCARARPAPAAKVISALPCSAAATSPANIR